jgi:mRNA-decapping enzyme subunit 2
MTEKADEEEREGGGSHTTRGERGRGGGMTQQKHTLQEVLDDVEIRFIMNLPPKELQSADRLFFQLEQAWWWYEDFVADVDETLPHFTQQQFTKKVMSHCSMLRPLNAQYDELFQKFRTWKGKIPLAGCIILNPSRKKLLMVKNWKGNSRTLPRGKVNEGEEAQDAAARETDEETGFDPAALVKLENRIEIFQNGQRTSMFVVPGVPEDFPFNPKVRKEISAVEWFLIDKLPKNTYGVFPFIKRLKRWIELERNHKSSVRMTASAARQLLISHQLQLSILSVPLAMQNEAALAEAKAQSALRPRPRNAATAEASLTSGEDLDGSNGTDDDDDDESDTARPSQSAPIPMCKPSSNHIEQHHTTAPRLPEERGTAADVFGTFAFDVRDIMLAFQ